MQKKKQRTTKKKTLTNLKARRVMISIFRIYYFFTLATRNGKKNSVMRPLPKGRIYAHTYKKRISVNMDMRIYAG